MRLVAKLRPDPLGELTALPRLPSWIEGGGEEGGKGSCEGRVKRTRGGLPPCLECVDAHVLNDC